MATTSSTTTSSPHIRSLIPARIDRLPWSRFHTRLVMALGVAWILDGLEITIAANVGPDLTLKNTLNMSAGAVSDIAWWYLIGEVIGALFFGRLSDKLGRQEPLHDHARRLPDRQRAHRGRRPNGGHWFIFLYATRVIAGMGIGGEYAAINSAIDEMIPAKFRGRIDLAVNGTYWAGAHPRHDRHAVGAQPRGAVLGLADRLHRRPDPRARASSTCGVTCPSRRAGRSCTAGRKRPRRRSGRSRSTSRATKGALPPVDESKELEITPDRADRLPPPARDAVPARTRPRSVLVSALMITQSFLYNAIFFTYGLVLEFFFHVKATDTAYYFFAFAAGNLAGPLTIGRLFDTIGRRKMISGTYITSGVAARDQRRPVQGRLPQRDDADALLGRRLLLRLRGRQRRLPDRERGLPARGPGEVHRGVLRHRPVLRRLRLALVRAPHRHRQRPEQPLRRLPGRRRGDDRSAASPRSSSASTPRASR